MENEAIHWLLEAFLLLAGGVGSYLVKRFNDDQRRLRDDAQEKQEEKNRETHESFQSMQRKLDDEREKRENLLAGLHNVELKFAEYVKREELNQMAQNMTNHMDTGIGQVVSLINALVKPGNSHNV